MQSDPAVVFRGRVFHFAGPRGGRASAAANRQLHARRQTRHSVPAFDYFNNTIFFV
jgi:hypothetical protein